MATRTKFSEHPLTTIYQNFKIMYWFICYYIARAIRPFFNLDKPKLTVTEFINSPKRSLIEVVLA